MGVINKYNLLFNLLRIKSKQESDILKNYLKKAQEDITSLLDEKRTLLDTVRSLQVRLFVPKVSI